MNKKIENYNIDDCTFNIPNFTLYNGNSIPSLGFGTFKANDAVELHNAISFAIKNGRTYKFNIFATLK